MSDLSPQPPPEPPPEHPVDRRTAGLIRGIPEGCERDPETGQLKPRKPKKPPKVLTSEKQPLAEVLEWVITHGPDDDTTHQQVFYRTIKDERPTEFARMLEQAQAAAPKVTESTQAVPEAPFPELEEAWGEYQAFLEHKRGAQP